jgi:RNA polymerase sigma-70 factor (ECF subfamily)
MLAMDSRSYSRSLVDRAQKGDREAFDDLVQLYRPRLEALVRARIGRQLQASVSTDDIVQDTLLQACRSLERFHWRDGDSFMKWLAAIAENVFRKVSRRREQTRKIRLEPGTAEDISPSTAMRREERFDRLKAALARLSADHREVIMLSRIEGLPVKEVALRMGRSQSAVKNLLLRAIKELRVKFGDTESLGLPCKSLRAEEMGNER